MRILPPKLDRTHWVALLLIALGVVCNYWVLQRFISPTGQMHSPTNRVIITVFDLLLIVSGVFFWRRKRSNLKRDRLGILVFSISLLLSLVGLEFYLRFHEAHRQPPVRVGFFRPNPRGAGSYRLLPNSVKELIVSGKKTIVRINSLGMPGSEVKREAAPGVVRVAFAGDSFTFGSFADDETKTFVGVFQRLLGSPIEALNFGVYGYSPDDIRLYLTEEILSFQPAYLVVAMYVGNDFSDTYLGLDKRRVNADGTLDWNEEARAARIPAEWRRRAAAPAVPNRRLGATFVRWLESLRSIRMFMNMTYQLDQRLVEKSDLSVFSVRDEFQSASFWSRKDYPPIARKAVAMTLDELARIEAICQANGITLAIVTLPNKEQVYVLRPEGDNYDIAYPQKFVAAFAAERGIPYLDLLPFLREATHVRGETPYMNNDAHFNNNGHRVTGEALARFFRSVVLDRRTSAAP